MNKLLHITLLLLFTLTISAQRVKLINGKAMVKNGIVFSSTFDTIRTQPTYITYLTCGMQLTCDTKLKCTTSIVENTNFGINKNLKNEETNFTGINLFASFSARPVAPYRLHY